MKSFIDEVIEGEGGGTVFVDTSGVNLSVCVDDGEPSYRSNVPTTQASAAELAAGLEAAGFTVMRDADEWRGQLQEWYEMGGGFGGEAW